MRVDPQHVEKLSRAIDRPVGGDPIVSLDISFMQAAFDRLTLWERGALSQVLMRASMAKRLSLEQRILLALFVHQESPNDD